MPPVSGTRVTLSDTVGLAVDMSPTIQLIDPFDVGLLSYIGMSSLDKPAIATEHKWMEDTLRPLTDVLNGNIDNAVTTVVATTANVLRQWDVIRMDSEVLVVTALNADGVTATVETRGTRSTAAAHTSGATISIIGVAFPEANDAGTARSTAKTSVSNYTQIFEEVVQVSSTLEAVEQWAPGSEYARQLAKSMKSLMIVIDKTLIYGKPYVGTATLPRSMGGLLHFISTNVTAAAGAQFSENLLQASLNLTYNTGGDVSCLAGTLTQKQAFNKFLDGTRRTGMSDRRAGSIVDSFMWDHGEVDFIIDRWLPSDYVLGLTKAYLGMGPLKGETLGHEILPKTTRLRQKGQITGEYTAEVKSQTSHFVITGLATVLI